jgi:hypothetical protein
MLWRVELSAVVLGLALVPLWSSAIAGETTTIAGRLLSSAAVEYFPRAAFLSFDTELFPSEASLSFLAPHSTTSSRRNLDYGIFGQELFAFVTKEVLSDARDEYRYSLIPGRLSRNGVDAPSDFDVHCRIAVEQFGKSIARLLAFGATQQEGDSAYFPSILGAATTFFIVRDAVGESRRAADDGESFSLEPKVGSRKIGVRFAIRW